jgi:hypothetical protein
MKTHGDPTKTIMRARGEGTIHRSGYLAFGDKNGKLKFAHVSIAEKALGKPINLPVQVHHVNGDRLDNRNENLVICPDNTYHALLHQRTRALDVTGNANATIQKCEYCGQWDDVKNLHISSRSCRHPECFKHYLSTRKRQHFYQGAMRSIREIAGLCGIDRKRLEYRLRKGWTLENATTVPVQNGNRGLMLCNRIKP